MVVVVVQQMELMEVLVVEVEVQEHLLKAQVVQETHLPQIHHKVITVVLVCKEQDV